MPESIVTVPLQIPAALLEKVREAQAQIAPGKKGKLVFRVDMAGVMTAGLGAKVGSHISVAAFVAAGQGHKPVGGGEVTIEWASS
jgi:hypothetical protein